MNTHPDLETMIARETSNPNPRQAAKALEGKVHEGATHGVLYSDRNHKKWVVVFIPNADIPNLGQAARKRFNGLPAVATAPVFRPPG